MDIRITPAKLGGVIPAVPSKSLAHRLLICAALADAPTEIGLPLLSQDIEATRRCLTALGAGIGPADHGWLRVKPLDRDRIPELPGLDCGESGSTLRFLLPVATACCPQVRFSAGGRLPERPLKHLLDALAQHGVRFSHDRLPFVTEGLLTSGDYQMPGNVSSQYISGLLLALPLFPGDSRLAVTTPLESAAYIEITLSALRQFGVSVDSRDGSYFIAGNQRFVSPGRITVAGDWSNAAFFLVAGALHGEVTVSGLDPDSPQGDRQIVALLRQFGAGISEDADCVTVEAAPLHGCTIDVSQMPDLLPVLAVAAACASGETRLVGGARLRLKESDRLASTAAMIRALGGRAVETADGLTVSGGGLSGGIVDSCRDHRIAMAAAIAACACRQPVTIVQAEAIAKSYPTFFTDYRRLGGIADGI